jgi:thiol-disulfide isomerase/thioredoxin
MDEENPQGETPQEETPQEEEPQENKAEQKKDTGSKQSSVRDFAKKLNVTMAVGVVVALIVGIVLGQVVLPGLGVGLIAMPSGDGLDAGTVDMAALEENVEAYLNENVLGPQGVEGKVQSIEAYDEDFFLVTVDIIKDGQSLGPQDLYLTRSGNAISGAVLFLDQDLPVVTPPQPPATGDQPGDVGNISSFTNSGDEIELVDGKPAIYLFSTTWCPHCKWISETFESVVKEYVDQGKIVAYHWELDIGDDTLTEEVETSVPAEHEAVYKKFNPGGSIPTFVFGGHYYRVGNGFEGTGDTANPTSEQSLENLAKEEADFRAVIEILLAEASQ